MSNDEHDERAARIADYIRRVKLAIAGYERGDAVSTWVHREHLVEGIELAAEFRTDAERPVCDCHTWPTAKEMHDYCVALEQRLEQAERRCAEHGATEIELRAGLSNAASLIVKGAQRQAQLEQDVAAAKAALEVAESSTRPREDIRALINAEKAKP